MACDNGKEGCKNIVNNIYPRLSSEVNSAISAINSGLSEIGSSLGGLSIPDDYLGSKVKDRIQKINNLINEDMSDVKMESSNIRTFISEKTEEHKEHIRQEELRKQREALKKKEKEKEEDDDDSDE